MFLAYNENGVLAEFFDYTHIVKCDYCHKPYEQTVTEQVPGFRERDEDICPYCGKINHSSCDVEYSNSKLSDEKLKELQIASRDSI